MAKAKHAVDQGAVSMIPMDDILLDPEFNARRPEGDEGMYTKVADLAESIKKEGLLSPVGVRLMTDEEKAQWDTEKNYLLILGFRRYQAVDSLGEKTIRATALGGTLEDAYYQNLAENIVRKDLKTWEMADRFREMAAPAEEDGFGASGRSIAKRIGMDQSSVNVYIALATPGRLNPEITKLWRKDDGRCTLPLLKSIIARDASHETQWERWLVSGCGMSPDEVKEAMEKVRGGAAPESPQRNTRPKRPSKKDLETALAACDEYEGRRSKQWVQGIQGALKFALGQNATIPGVFNPVDPDNGEDE